MRHANPQELSLRRPVAGGGRNRPPANACSAEVSSPCGADALEFQLHLPGASDRRDDAAPGGLQTDPRRAAAVGFPPGHAGKREVAAYVVCRALGWDLVPPTVLRTGPHGRGSVQLLRRVSTRTPTSSPSGTTPHYRTSCKSWPSSTSSSTTPTVRAGIACARGRRLHRRHRPGPLLPRRAKLRTVIWDFAGEPIPRPGRGPGAAGDLTWPTPTGTPTGLGGPARCR